MRNFVSYLYISVSGHIFNGLINIFLKIAYIYAIYSRFDFVLHCLAFTVRCTYAGHVNKHCTYNYTVRVCSYFAYKKNTVHQYILYLCKSNLNLLRTRHVCTSVYFRQIPPPPPAPPNVRLKLDIYKFPDTVAPNLSFISSLKVFERTLLS